METKNFRSLFVAGMVAVSTIVSSEAFANNRPEPSLAGNRLISTKENKAIQARIMHIDNHEARIDELMTAKKQARKAGNDAEVAFYKQELKKECADLRWDRSYLEAEKDAYLYDQKQDIKAAKDAKCDHRKDLREAKRDLRRDVRKGNEEMLVEDAQKLAFLQRAVDADQARVDDLKDDYDNYVAYLKDEIKDADGNTTA